MSNISTPFQVLNEFNSRIYYISFPTYFLASVYEVLFLVLFLKIYCYWHDSTRRIANTRLPQGIQDVISDYIGQDSITISVETPNGTDRSIIHTATSNISIVNAYSIAQDIRGYMRVIKILIWIWIIVNRKLSILQAFFQLLNMVHKSDLIGGITWIKPKNLLSVFRFLHGFVTWVGLIPVIPIALYYMPIFVCDMLTLALIMFLCFHLEGRLVKNDLRDMKWRLEFMQLNLILAAFLADMVLGLDKLTWKQGALYHYQLKYMRGFSLDDLIMIL